LLSQLALTLTLLLTPGTMDIEILFEILLERVVDLLLQLSTPRQLQAGIKSAKQIDQRT